MKHLMEKLGELYERKAEAFLQLCDFQSAAMHLRKVYHMSPKEGIRERLAFIVFLQVGLGIFLERLNRGTLSNSFSPSIACLAAMNRFNDCLQMVNAEVELDKSNADLFVLRARLFEYFGKASCCFCNLQEALALDPDHTEAQVLLRKMTKEAERSKDCAVTLAIKGNLKGALLKINRAINYNPLDEKYFLFRYPGVFGLIPFRCGHWGFGLLRLQSLRLHHELRDYRVIKGK
uniref:Tetratricopeptide repeat domain 16 n=1 Tax=Pseudonaja textilis TaxID=8673 RepID=A0A670YJ91_PSETE